MRAVIFDLDQTLFPEADFVRSGFRAVAAHLAEHCGGAAAALTEEMESILWQEGRGRVFDLLRDRHGWGARVAPETLLHIYRTHVPVLRMHADAADLLARLTVPLGLVTDGQPHRATWQDCSVGADDAFRGHRLHRRSRAARRQAGGDGIPGLPGTARREAGGCGLRR